MSFEIRIDETAFTIVIAGDGETITRNLVNGTHKHALADLLQSGAVAGQVVAWNGTVWAPAAGGGVWGSITGTLSAQTDLVAALAAKQPLAAVLTNTTASFTTAEEAKLAGIAAGATSNSTDATLLARANHTGTQAISTVSGLQAGLDAKVDDSQISVFGLTLVDDADAATARATLGLGSLATQNGTFTATRGRLAASAQGLGRI